LRHPFIRKKEDTSEGEKGSLTYQTEGSPLNEKLNVDVEHRWLLPEEKRVSAIWEKISPSSTHQKEFLQKERESLP